MIRIGIDLGGTNIAVGAVDDSHTIVSRVSVPTLAHRPAAEVVGDMGDAVEAALAKAGLSIGGCRSIGIGSPGTCNSAAGVVERAYNLGWDHVPVCRMLEERFHVPCRLSNDANCAALAEQVAGAAVLAAVWAAFILWTFAPPDLPLFADPETGLRGIR